MMQSAGQEQGSCTKPALSYTQLIQQALSSRADGAMRLHAIYDYLRDRYAYFGQSGEGWKVGQVPVLARLTSSLEFGETRSVGLLMVPKASSGKIQRMGAGGPTLCRMP